MNDGAIERWFEWLGDIATYRPSDFLMFSPRVYWRMFELHNEAWWPLPLLLPGLGLALIAACHWRSGVGQRAGAVVLAACSGFVGLAFVQERYAAINWAATGLALLWAAQGALLLVMALGREPPLPAGAAPRRLATVLAFWALVGQPLLAPLNDRPLAQAEVFGLAPDPTTLAILAWGLAWQRPAAGPRAWLWWGAAGTALACGLWSVATLALLGDWQALLLLAALAAPLVQWVIWYCSTYTAAPAR